LEWITSLSRDGKPSGCANVRRHVYWFGRLPLLQASGEHDGLAAINEYATLEV
jgi:hypothetical protein